MKYIGDKKIRGTEPGTVEGTLRVSFKDGEELTMNENLYNICVHDDKRDGGVTDRVRLVLATKFLQEMADYGLGFYMVSTIGQGMETLAHNLREEKISKMFGCEGTNDIALETILETEEK